MVRPNSRHPDRGFSLLLVLMVLILLAVIGGTAALVGTMDFGTAGARANRAQALAAAEAGLSSYLGLFAPADCAPGTTPTWTPVNLTPIHTDADADVELQARYGITVAPVQPAGIDGCSMVFTGEVADGGGHVVGQAQLNTVILIERNEYGYSGIKDSTPRATGSDATGRSGYEGAATPL